MEFEHRWILCGDVFSQMFTIRFVASINGVVWVVTGLSGYFLNSSILTSILLACKQLRKPFVYVIETNMFALFPVSVVLVFLYSFFDDFFFIPLNFLFLHLRRGIYYFSVSFFALFQLRFVFISPGSYCYEFHYNILWVFCVTISKLVCLLDSLSVFILRRGEA